MSYVVLLAHGSRVWSVLETDDPGHARRVAEEKEEHEPNIDRVSIHEFPVGLVPPVLEITCDNPDDDRTVVYVATKPRGGGGIWKESFFQQFHITSATPRKGSRHMWVL